MNRSGIYTLSVRDSVNGCSATANVIVLSDTAAPVVSISASKNPVDFNESINMSVITNTPLSSVQWQPASKVNDSSSLQVTAQITELTTFIVSAKDNKGCENTASLLIKVNQVDCIYLPNTFTPDGNGRNETYKPLGTKLKSLVIFRIFDRWGNLVFETTAAIS